MAVSPFVTLTANLQSILGDAELGGAAIMITLCGYGQTIPVVPGQGVLADAGVPQVIVQSGSTPISVELFSNEQITPATTFYEIAVIDENENVIQSANYQFNQTSAGTVDLSDLIPIVGPVGQLVVEATAGSYPGKDFTLTYNPFNEILIGLFYRGILQRPEIDYDISGNAVILTFPATLDAEGNPTLWAVYQTSGTAMLPFPLVIIPSGAMPGTVYALPSTGTVLALYYNGIFQRPGIDYTVSGATINLNFSTRSGASLYAILLPN
jgi:hypothetical protein